MAKTHTPRPAAIRKGKSWMCKCQTINVWEAEVCKMIDIERLREAERQANAIEKNMQERAGIKPLKPKRERFRHNKAERTERAKMLELFTGTK